MGYHIPKNHHRAIVTFITEIRQASHYLLRKPEFIYNGSDITGEFIVRIMFVLFLLSLFKYSYLNCCPELIRLTKA